MGTDSTAWLVMVVRSTGPRLSRLAADMRVFAHSREIDHSRWVADIAGPPDTGRWAERIAARLRPWAAEYSGLVIAVDPVEMIEPLEAHLADVNCEITAAPEGSRTVRALESVIGGRRR